MSDMPEPTPVPNELPSVWDLVIEDMRKRDAFGVRKYGTHLQPMNGRDSIVDLYQELLDAVVYTRQFIYERDNVNMLLSQALYQLLANCEHEDVSIEISYDVGRSLSGEYFDLPEEEQKKHIKQGPKGWRVEVAGISYVNDDGKEELYPTLGKAVSAGIHLLGKVLKERKENK